MGRIEPFFVSASNRKLYAVYYAAAGEPRCQNVVYCPPFGQEHVRLYRALHESALRMSRSGFDVLRFEFTGTGNSLDPVETISIEMWHQDLCAAVGKVCERSGYAATSVFAARLGAAVTLHRPNHLPAISQLVLFDPLLSGMEYVAQLESLHRDMCKHSNKYLYPTGKLALTDEELAGHTATTRLLTDLRSWKLEHALSTVSCPIHAVVSHPDVFFEVSSVFEENDADVCLEPYTCGWNDAGVLEANINPKRCLENLEEKLVQN